MRYHVGLDVSHKATPICVVDGDRRVIWQGVADTQPELIADELQALKEDLALVGLETGSLAPRLYHGMKRQGLPVVCMDARRAADTVKARPEKSDKADARALAEMLASGWYTNVHVKSQESHRMKALLGARDRLVRVKRELYGQVRGLFKPFGIKIPGRAGSKRFDEEARASCNHDDVLYGGIAALLETLAAVEGQLAALDKQVTLPSCFANSNRPSFGLMNFSSMLVIDRHS